jgi:hypothetical protein
METTKKIVEAYVRYMKRWATIPNIRCDAPDLGVSWGDITAAVLSCSRSFTCYRYVC